MGVLVSNCNPVYLDVLTLALKEVLRRCIIAMQFRHWQLAVLQEA